MYGALAIFLFCSVCVCVLAGSRKIMLKGISQTQEFNGLDRQVIVQGTFKEMALLMLAFGLCGLSSLLIGVPSSLLPDGLSAILFGVFFLVFMLLMATDTVLFHYARQRIGIEIKGPLCLSGIRAVMTASQRLIAAAMLMGILGLCAGSAWFLYWFWQQPLALYIYWVFAEIFFVGWLVSRSRKISDADAEKISLNHESEFLKNQYSTQLKRQLNMVADDALSNFFRFMFKNKNIWKRLSRLPDNTKNKSILRDLRFINESTPVSRHIETKRYKRIIMVAMESFSLQFISSYNKNVPKEATPFFNYLTKKFHTMENYYTTGCRTDGGLTSFFCSRLPDTWSHSLSNHESIFSVLNKAGYDTHIIRTVNENYGNYKFKLPTVFKASNYTWGDDLEAEYKNVRRCYWGVNDSILFNKNIDMLKKHDINGKSICTFLITTETHPNFDSDPGLRYPEPVRHSRLLRSIYQADLQLRNFYTGLLDNQLLDDETLLLVFADHSCPWGNGVTELTGCDPSIPDRIPMIFITRHKNVFQQIPRDTLCCQLDMLPTLCAGLGFKVPDSAMGGNLFEPTPRVRVSNILGNDYLLQTEKVLLRLSLDEPGASQEELAVQKWLAAKVG